MGAEPSRLELVVFVGFPSVGCRPHFACYAFSGGGWWRRCFYLAGGTGAANIGAAWATSSLVGARGALCGGEKAKTALTAARGFCKLRKSWSKVRFRSETKPGRRRSAPGPENQIPIPYPLDPKTKFLSLTHADDTGLRESRRRIRSESRPSATKPRKLLVLLAAVIAMITSSTASAGGPTSDLLLSGLKGGSGSTVGPGGALYVTESAAGRISRVDPRTGKITTFASGLPQSIVGIGGAIDVAFIGGTAYALVTLVGPEVDGKRHRRHLPNRRPRQLHRGRGHRRVRPDNPPTTPFDVPTGVQYALETYRGGFLVTDGHHNRVYQVTRAGEVSELIQFGNIVPTGLATRATRSTWPRRALSPTSPGRQGGVVQAEVTDRHQGGASGAPLLVDVEFGRGRDLYALSQGEFPVAGFPGAPAVPNTGSLVKVNGDGGFDLVVDDLNQPTSVEFIRNTAYVVTLTGEIWKVENPSGPPHGASH